MLEQFEPQTVLSMAIIGATLLEVLFWAAFLTYFTDSLGFKVSLLRIGFGTTIAALSYPIIGFDLMYGGEIGSTIQSLLFPQELDIAFSYDYVEYSYFNDLVFQTSYSIASVQFLTIAIGSKLSLSRLFIVQLLHLLILYPLFGRISWGTDWLNELGFSDFSGAVLIALIPAFVALSLTAASPGKRGDSKNHWQVKALILLIAYRLIGFASISMSHGDSLDDFNTYYAEVLSLSTIALAALAVSIIFKRNGTSIATTCLVSLIVSELAVSVNQSPVLMVVAAPANWSPLTFPITTILLSATIVSFVEYRTKSKDLSISVALATGAISGLTFEYYLNSNSSFGGQMAGVGIAAFVSIGFTMGLMRTLDWLQRSRHNESESS